MQLYIVFKCRNVHIDGKKSITIIIIVISPFVSLCVSLCVPGQEIEYTIKTAHITIPVGRIHQHNCVKWKDLNYSCVSPEASRGNLTESIQFEDGFQRQGRFYNTYNQENMNLH